MEYKEIIEYVETGKWHKRGDNGTIIILTSDQ